MLQEYQEAGVNLLSYAPTQLGQLASQAAGHRKVQEKIVGEDLWGLGVYVQALLRIDDQDVWNRLGEIDRLYAQFGQLILEKSQDQKIFTQLSRKMYENLPVIFIRDVESGDVVLGQVARDPELEEIFIQARRDILGKEDDNACLLIDWVAGTGEQQMSATSGMNFRDGVFMLSLNLAKNAQKIVDTGQKAGVEISLEEAVRYLNILTGLHEICHDLNGEESILVELEADLPACLYILSQVAGLDKAKTLLTMWTEYTCNLGGGDDDPYHYSSRRILQMMKDSEVAREINGALVAVDDSKLWNFLKCTKHSRS